MDVMLTDAPVYTAGGGFPWGLLIIGGIVYLLWRNGVFDGGRGRFGNGPRSGGGYGGGYGPAQTVETPGYGTGSGQGSYAGYGDLRAQFEEWHRQMHESGAAHGHAPAATQAPAAPPAAPATEAPAPGNDEPPRQV